MSSKSLAVRALRRPAVIAVAVALIILAAVALISIMPSNASSRPGSTKPTIVLVHGAWADASSWDQVIPILQREGYAVDAPPNPLR